MRVGLLKKYPNAIPQWHAPHGVAPAVPAPIKTRILVIHVWKGGWKPVVDIPSKSARVVLAS